MSVRIGLLAIALAFSSSAFSRGGGGHSGGHSSGGSHYVAPHVTKNGTYVQGHYRSNPNGSSGDNWSTKGNVNPYTGEPGKADAAELKSAPSAHLYTPAHAPTHSTSTKGGSSQHGSRAFAAPKARTHDYTRTGGAAGERSSAARSAFQRQHPCPSTGRTSGACPGYVVDHVRPLKRGGPDSPSNMQWQTIEAAKAKDRVE